MFCPVCKDPSTDMRIINSRKYKDIGLNATRRRYKCLVCGARITTMETPLREVTRYDNKQ